MSTNQAAEFSGLRITIYDLSGARWVAALDVGRGLGYADPRGIHAIYRRHADEFTDRDTAVVKTTTPSGEQETRLFSETGVVLLTMFANTSRAKDFRAWAKRVLARQPEAAEPVALPVAALEKALHHTQAALIQELRAQAAGLRKDLQQAQHTIHLMQLARRSLSSEQAEEFWRAVRLHRWTAQETAEFHCTSVERVRRGVREHDTLVRAQAAQGGAA